LAATGAFLAATGVAAFLAAADDDCVGTDLATFFTAVDLLGATVFLATGAFFTLFLAAPTGVVLGAGLAAALPTTLLTAFLNTEVAVFLALGAMSTIASLALLSRLGPCSE
jgi:hypothetical protein